MRCSAGRTGAGEGAAAPLTCRTIFTCVTNISYQWYYYHTHTHTHTQARAHTGTGSPPGMCFQRCQLVLPCVRRCISVGRSLAHERLGENVCDADAPRRTRVASCRGEERKEGRRGQRCLLAIREELCAKIRLWGTPSLRKFKEGGRLDVVAPKPAARPCWRVRVTSTCYIPLISNSRDPADTNHRTSNPVYISVANSSHWLSSAHFSSRTLSMKGAEQISRVAWQNSCKRFPCFFPFPYFFSQSTVL